MGAPQADPGLICPLHKKDVSKVCHKCPWYTKVIGTNPQTGDAHTEDWQCAMAWIPLLTIETSQKARQTTAAVESFRNEMVEQNEELMKLRLTDGIDELTRLGKQLVTQKQIE